MNSHFLGFARGPGRPQVRPPSQAAKSRRRVSHPVMPPSHAAESAAKSGRRVSRQVTPPSPPPSQPPDQLPSQELRPSRRYARIETRRKRGAAMGRSQAVRHGTLDPAFGGSNPPAPAIFGPQSRNVKCPAGQQPCRFHCYFTTYYYLLVNPPTPTQPTRWLQSQSGRSSAV